MARPLDFDPYAELGVDRDASLEDIKNAWRSIAKQHHPDKGEGGDKLKFQRGKEAYEILSDAEKRQEYDETGGVNDRTPDNDMASVYSYVVDAFMDAFRDFAVEPNDLKVIASMKKYLRHEQSNWEDQIEGATLMVERTNQVLERLSFKGDGHDVVASKLRRQATESEALIAKANEELDYIQRAIEYSAHYVYRRDDPDMDWGQEVAEQLQRPTPALSWMTRNHRG